MKNKLPAIRKSNVLFVRDLMEVSIHGPLVESFIIEAIRYYCEKNLAAPEPEDSNTMVINPRIWWNIAKEINDKLIERYEKKGDD